MKQSTRVLLISAVVAVTCAGAFAGYCTSAMKKFGSNFSYCYKSNTNTGIPMMQYEEDLIVQTHNSLRAKVANGEVENQPSATNMEKMIWDDELAHGAQMWAEKCTGRHDANAVRSIPGKYSVGQNLYMSTQEDPWNKAVTAWFNEHNWFVFGQGSTNGKEVGHYTQVVWATSSRVGCGRAHCPNLSLGYIYYCNYAPAGNIMPKQNSPYKTGATASACPNTENGNGLCDCGGKACYNGGKLDPNTCECKCYSGFGPQNNFDANCGVECSKAGDNPEFPCSQLSSLSMCNEEMGGYLACPETCKVCTKGSYIKPSAPKTPSTSSTGVLKPSSVPCNYQTQCTVDIGKTYCIDNGTKGKIQMGVWLYTCTCDNGSTQCQGVYSPSS